jgi:hypothetical protein
MRGRTRCSRCNFKPLAYGPTIEHYRSATEQGQMINWIAASIAILSAAVFLGWLAYTIGAVPLAIVIAITVALMLFDFYDSMRRPEA